MPLARDPRLRLLSADHHHALALARRSSAAADAGDAAAREGWARADEAFRRDLEPHFFVEEAVLLPALEAAGARDLVARTRDEHAALRALFRRGAGTPADCLRALGRVLQAHVRFEERELLEYAQAHLEPAVLEVLGAAHAQLGRRDRPAGDEAGGVWDARGARNEGNEEPAEVRDRVGEPRR